MSADFPLAPLSPLGNPAPFWFLAAFKVIGFVLHMGPMHLWYAGVPLIALLTLAGGEQPRRLARRLANPMPIAIALGVNFGIVPLLFLQVGYYPVFYPATILMGWFWFAVIPLLMVAYYGVYLYVVQVRQERLNRWGIGAGVVSAAAFLAIGFLFSNVFSLMADDRRMLALYDQTAVGGAVTGTALNVGDPALWPRWLMMLGMAVTTTAAFIVADAVRWARREPAAYRAWAGRWGCRLYAFGMVWFAAAGAWYWWGAVPSAIREAVAGDPRLVALVVATAASPLVAWWRCRCAAARGEASSEGRSHRAAAAGAPERVVSCPRLMSSFGIPVRGLPRPATAIAAPSAWRSVAAAQAAVLILNAVARHWVQQRQLAAFFDPSALPVRPQWGPMAVFLALFVAGLVVIVWMLRQVTRHERRA